MKSDYGSPYDFKASDDISYYEYLNNNNDGSSLVGYIYEAFENLLSFDFNPWGIMKNISDFFYHNPTLTLLLWIASPIVLGLMFSKKDEKSTETFNRLPNKLPNKKPNPFKEKFDNFIKEYKLINYCVIDEYYHEQENRNVIRSYIFSKFDEFVDLYEEFKNSPHFNRVFVEEYVEKLIDNTDLIELPYSRFRKYKKAMYQNSGDDDMFIKLVDENEEEFWQNIDKSKELNKKKNNYLNSLNNKENMDKEVHDLFKTKSSRHHRLAKLAYTQSLNNLEELLKNDLDEIAEKDRIADNEITLQAYRELIVSD